MSRRDSSHGKIGRQARQYLRGSRFRMRLSLEKLEDRYLLDCSGFWCLDTDFGHVTAGFGGDEQTQARAMTQDSSGNIYLGGYVKKHRVPNDDAYEDWALAKLDSSGALDTDFGTDGLVAFEASDPDAQFSSLLQERIYGLTIQNFDSEDWIVAVGSSYHEFGGSCYGRQPMTIARFDIDTGEQDTTFGTTQGSIGCSDGFDGLMTITLDVGDGNFSRLNIATGVTIQTIDSQEKIVVGGWTDFCTNDACDVDHEIMGTHMAVARLCANGHLDDGTPETDGGCGGSGFGDTNTDQGTNFFRVVGLGNSDDSSSISDIRHNEKECRANAVTLDDSNRIVLAGTCLDVDDLDTDLDFAVTRFTSAGQPDSTWDSSFFVNSDDTNFRLTYIDFGDSPTHVDEAFAVAIQSDDKIVVAGNTQFSSDDEFAVTRLLANGAGDTNFGDDTEGAFGIQILNDTGELVAGGAARSIVLSSDDIMVAGYSDASPPYFYGIYLDDAGDVQSDPFDVPFKSGFSDSAGDYGYAVILSNATDQFVVAGAHVPNSGPDEMGAIQLCFDPDADPCSGTLSPTSSGGKSFRPSAVFTTGIWSVNERTGLARSQKESEPGSIDPKTDEPTGALPVLLTAQKPMLSQSRVHVPAHKRPAVSIEQITWQDGLLCEDWL